MTFSEGQRAHYFEEVAAEFGRHTLPYPDEIADRVLDFAGASGRGLRVLEIGSGAGEATALFANRPLSIVCLEPGKALLQAAREKFQDHVNVGFVQSTFDEWSPAGQRFDVIIAARSLHWVRQDLRFTKTAGLLAAGGVLAIFHKQHLIGDSPCAREIEALIMAATASHSRGDARLLRSQFADSCHFTGVRDLTLSRTVQVDAGAYIAAMRSNARLQSLPVPVREHLLGSIAEVVNRHGGKTEVDYLVYLTMGRRRRGPRWWRQITARWRTR